MSSLERLYICFLCAPLQAAVQYAFRARLFGQLYIWLSRTLFQATVHMLSRALLQTSFIHAFVRAFARRPSGLVLFFCPIGGAADRFMPLTKQLGALFFTAVRVENLICSAKRGDFVEILPHADRQSRQIGGP